MKETQVLESRVFLFHRILNSYLLWLVALIILQKSTNESCINYRTYNSRKLLKYGGKWVCI